MYPQEGDPALHITTNIPWITSCFHDQEDFPGDSMTQTWHQTPSPCTGGPGEELEPGTASTCQPGQEEAHLGAAWAPLCSMTAEFPCYTYGKSWCSQFTKHLQSICLSGWWCTCHATFCQPVIGCTELISILLWHQVLQGLIPALQVTPGKSFSSSKSQFHALYDGNNNNNYPPPQGHCKNNCLSTTNGTWEIGKTILNAVLFIDSVLLFYITLDIGTIP